MSNKDINPDLVALSEKRNTRHLKVVTDPLLMITEKPPTESPSELDNEKNEYPVFALPEILQDLTKFIVENDEIPSGIVAHSLLSAVNGLVQTLINVEWSPGEISSTNLYLMTFADSGDRKSKADSIAFKRIELYQSNEYMKYQNEMEDYKKKLTEFKNKEYEPIKPKDRTFLTQTATSEALVEMLDQGQPHASLICDEAARFLGGYSMSKDNKSNTLGILSKLWDGGTYGHRTVSKGVKYLIGKRLNAHLMFQPYYIEKLI